MSNNEARWALSGGFRPSQSPLGFWIISLCLLCLSALAQVESVAKVAHQIAGEGAERGAVYVAIVFAIGCMAFAWWQSYQLYRLAHESNMAAVEVAKSLQRLADLQQEMMPATRIDDDIAELINLRKRQQEQRNQSKGV